MIIWGWGKVTKKMIGGVSQRTCSYCNTTSIWKLCIMRTWVTIFFIPIIPYKKMYCIVCPNCSSYIKLTQEQFEQIRLEISETGSRNGNANEVADNLKYEGKTETQINYLKQMEEQDKKTSNI